MHVYVVLYDVYEVFHHYAFYKIDVYIHLYSTNSPILLLINIE